MRVRVASFGGLLVIGAGSIVLGAWARPELAATMALSLGVAGVLAVAGLGGWLIIVASCPRLWQSWE